MAKKKMMYEKGSVINMNYPPADYPLEELERFWGSPDDYDPNAPCDIEEFSALNSYPEGRRKLALERKKKHVKPKPSIL